MFEFVDKAAKELKKKYAKIKKEGLDVLADAIPGGVAKAKRKHKKDLEKIYEKR